VTDYWNLVDNANVVLELIADRRLRPHKSPRGCFHRLVAPCLAATSNNVS
jgi:hypothetical protein